MKSNSSLIYSVFLVLGDFLALVTAFVTAFLIRGRWSDIPVAHPIRGIDYLEAFLLLLPFWILTFALLGLYAGNIYEKRFSEIGRLLVGTFIGLLFIISYDYMTDNRIFPSKLVPIYGFGLGFLFLLVFRNLARTTRSLLFRYGMGITNLLIVGGTRISEELVKSLSDSRRSGYNIVGLVGGKLQADGHFPHHFSSFEEAVSKLKADDIHGIVQTELYADSDKNNKILEYAQTNHISYRFVPGNSELFVGNIAVELFRSSIPVIAVHQTALIGWGRIVKRVTDLLFSLIMLVPALPVMLVVGLLIKIFDPRGPVFYKDRRLTRFNNSISIYKFRSLKQAYSGLSPEDAFAKMGRPELIAPYRKGGDQLPSDPRISHIGRFIRRTSLDELPQLFNILRGDISFVGPRALHPDELNQYHNKDLILTVKSGLTGLAQVSGRRDISFEERRKLDLYYVQNWSLWLDLIILLKTIRVVIERSGAR